MECYGIRGNMHLLISSYLNGRKQFVNFGGYESNCEKIEAGVPQGSVLGPLLFLIHINDLQNNTSLRVLNFADDTMLYKIFTKTTYLNDSKIFNTELSKTSDWLIVNKLKLNLNKTRSMLLHQSKNSFWKNIDLTVKIGKTVIKKTNSYKYLGINIDRNLNWSEHIETIKTKLQKTLGVLYKTRHFLNEKALYLIFNSLFMSNVRYGLLCWGRANKKCINDINVLINRSLRCIHNMKYDGKVRK